MGDTFCGERTPQSLVGMTRRRLVGLLAGAAALGGGFAWDEADAKGKKGKKKKKKKKKANPFKDIAISGDASATGETFAGKLTIASFRYDEATQQILAVGTLMGTVTKAGGTTEPIAPQAVEFPYDGAGPGPQRDISAQSGAAGSLLVAMGPIFLVLLGLNFALNGFSLAPAIGKSKARVNAVNEIMAASNPQAVTAGLNSLRATYPA